MGAKKEVSENRMLEAVEIMLFEVVAEYRQLIAGAAERGKTILSDEQEVDRIIDGMAELGMTIEKIHDLVSLETANRRLKFPGWPNVTGPVICNKIYQQFRSSLVGHPRGLILNGHRSCLCTKAILSRLATILSKRRRRGLFDYNCPLLQVLSNNDDLFFSLFPPIDAWQEKIGCKNGLISKMCHDIWKMKVIEALIDDGSGNIPLRQRFNFHSMSIDKNYVDNYSEYLI